jgi:hypothetical protein
VSAGGAGQQQARPAHSNCIVSITDFREGGAAVAGMFTTAGADGRVVLWMVPEAAKQ